MSTAILWSCFGWYLSFVKKLSTLIIGHLKVVFSGMALRMAVLITHPGVTQFQAEILQHLFSREPIQLIWLNHLLFLGQPWGQQFVFSEISLWNGLSWNVVHTSPTRYIVYLMTFEQHHQAENSNYVRVRVISKTNGSHSTYSVV